ncbi:hypothetical protein H4R34_002779 [Dimargaris verticillata]|uniref:VPS37 C-terminal domain-containing protein n=1 Tax=Dimargaris verticillata TaxID=2761393 RepID=A0A9W8E8Y6_9FUNG|nr:hypothetical protein H4R34_002779 [Dimargaris verticillata]
MGIPEAMNNYGLSDPDAAQAKQQALQTEFPTFANKSAEDLEDILKYEDLFQSYFDGLEQVQMNKTVQLELEIGNETLSKKILGQEKDMDELRQTIADRQAILDSLTTAFYEKIKTQHDAIKPFAPSHLLQGLKSAAHQADQDSDQLAQRFLYDAAGGNNGSPGLVDSADQFVKEFRQRRKQYHALMAKYERATTDPSAIDGLPAQHVL